MNYGGDLCISGSTDRTCKVWGTKTGKCVHTLRGPADEVDEVVFSKRRGTIRREAGAFGTC